MIATVIPAIRLPSKASDEYDYNIPEALASVVMLGAVVIVPFAGRNVPALVSSISDVSKHDKPLKDIFGFAQGLSPFPPYTAALWKRYAEVFATTPSRIAWLAMPNIPMRSIQTCCVASFETLANATTSAQHEPATVFVNNPRDQVTMVKKILAAAKDKQVLILVPTVDEIELWRQEIPGANIYHSGLATGAKYKVACSTGDGTAKIVIGTKSAIFLPWKNLFAISIISSGSSTHLQSDSDPRFDSRVAAFELSKISGAKLVSLDPLPPFGNTQSGSNNVWKELNAPRPVSAIVHDLHDAVNALKTKVLICDELYQALDQTILNDGRALLLLNRRGVSTSYVCEDCGTFVSCPTCLVPTTVHDDRLSCFICDKLYPLPENCHKCKSIKLKAIGSGSKTLYSIIKKRFPNSTILHLDKDHWHAKPDDAQIVVGTTAIFRTLSPNFKPFDLSADILLGAGTNMSDIWSVEESARNLRSIAATITDAGNIHVQTFDRESPALLALADPKKFINKELEERSAFNYPPKNILITIYGALESESTLEKTAKELVLTIGNALPKAICQEPVWSRPKLFRKKFRLTITLKIPSNESYTGLAKILPKGFAAEAKML